MQIQAKLGGILYNRGWKPGSNYLDLEVGMEFWNRVQVPGSDYKSLSQHDHNALRVAYANLRSCFSSLVMLQRQQTTQQTNH